MPDKEEHKTHRVVVIDGQKESVIARLWWDGSQICCDNESFLNKLKHFDDLNYNKKNRAVLDKLPSLFKNGYLHAYRIGD